MLSKNEMKVMERFVKFINEDEDYIKYRNQINEKLRERGLPEIE
jgi:hypothetical protein